jgi:hypothetical protein
LQRTHRPVRGLAVGGLVLALWAVAPASRAASSVQAGWWTSAPAATAPDAQDGGLLVQGGVDPAKPVAYAAVAYALAPGEQPVSLRLAVADGSASTPGAQLVLCPLAGPFSPAQGGPMADGPEFDCATTVTAAPAGGGTTYTFDGVGALARNGSLAVAIVPAAATDRVVLATPGPDSLATRPVATPAASPGAGATTNGSPDTTSASFDSGSFAEPAAAPDGPPVDLGTVAAAPAPGADAAAAAPTAPRPTGTTAAPGAAAKPAKGSAGGGFPRGALAAGAAVLAGGLWFSAGRARDGEEQSPGDDVLAGDRS